MPGKKGQYKMALVKPGGSTQPLMDRVSPLAHEQVTRAKLHLPELEEPARPLLALAVVNSPGLSSFSPPITCLPLLQHLSAYLFLPTEVLGWPRGGAKDSSRTGSVG